jgi:hypothetical protein
MRFRTFTIGYLVLVGVCTTYLLSSLAFIPSTPLSSRLEVIVRLLLIVLTLPWSFFVAVATFLIAVGSALVEGPIIGNLYPTVAIGTLCYFGAAVINVYLAKRIRKSRATGSADDSDSSEKGR